MTRVIEQLRSEYKNLGLENREKPSPTTGYKRAKTNWNQIIAGNQIVEQVRIEHIISETIESQESKSSSRMEASTEICD